MALKILIDMIKLRAAMVNDPSMTLPEGYFYSASVDKGLKSLREIASFTYTCRKCEDAPCIAVCPAEALEKDENGIIDRHTNLCVACKSCVTICPFGTMMNDFFDHRINRDRFFDLKNEKELSEFIKICPNGAVTLTDCEEAPEKNIHMLNEAVLVKDFVYITEKE